MGRGSALSLESDQAFGLAWLFSEDFFMTDDDLRDGAERAETYTIDDEPEVESEDARKAREWAERLGLSLSDLAVFCRHGFHYDQISVKNTPARRSLLAHLKRSDVGPSRWQLISGLYVENGFSEIERRKRLRALHKTVVLLIKRALARHAADAMGGERSPYWDPAAEVCRDLEISQSKLAALCKEFSGHSLIQMVDCVRAERIKKMMRGSVRTFVRNYKTQCASLAADAKGKIDLWEVWKALKDSRRWPQFCQNTWALEFGFCSSRRMYRACLAVWKQTPHQMELAMIAECLEAAEGVESPDIGSEKETTLGEIEALLREIRYYSDEYGEGIAA